MTTPQSIRRPHEHGGKPPLAAPAISAAQLEANRANAQLSTGPTSACGKAASSLNAVKSALTGRTVLLPSDDTAAYERHLQSFAVDHSPVGPRETDLVQSLADTWWRLARIPALEAALYAKGHLEFSASFDEHEPALRLSLIDAETFLKYEKQFRNLQLQESRLYRRYEKDGAELRSLQQARQQPPEDASKPEATRPLAATAPSQLPTPAANGFVFSTSQIELPFASPATANAAQPPLHGTAQAA